MPEIPNASSLESDSNTDHPDFFLPPSTGRRVHKPKDPISGPKFPSHGDHPWSVEYDKETDRLKLFLPQEIRGRGADRNPEGVTTVGVYLEISPGESLKEPSITLALAPRETVGKLKERLALYHIKADEWPMTYTNKKSHGKEPWYSEKPWKQEPVTPEKKQWAKHVPRRERTAWKWEQDHPRPALLIPFAAHNDQPKVIRPDTILQGYALVKQLNDEGFITDKTRDVMNLVVRQFANRKKAHSFSTKNLTESLEGLYPEMGRAHDR